MLPTAKPAEAIALGLGAALLIGMTAGLYPAMRAAHPAAADALLMVS